MADKGGTVETIKTVAYALGIAILIRSFLFEPFHIPSGSMKDTLLIGDFIFVSKSSYGYSRYSFPLGIVPIPGRVLEGEKQPERGDIIVFRLPTNTRIDYIKRLIGLPGDTVQVRGGVLYLNGQAVPRERVADHVETQGNRVYHVPKYRETLPNGVSYYVLDALIDGEVDDTPMYTVPEGHYFFMGDNRDNSNDSRQGVGMVPYENLVGRAELIAISSDGPFWEVWNWRFGRFFTIIR